MGVAVGPGTRVREGVAEAVGVSVIVGVVVGNENVARETGVFVGVALCGSASPVLTVAMAVSMISASLTVAVDWPLLQDASITAARNKGTCVLPIMFILPLPLMFHKETLIASGLFDRSGAAIGGFRHSLGSSTTRRDWASSQTSTGTR